MRWDAKITDTAKISVEVRWILIDRVDAILNDLKTLRQRAIGYASPESVAALATRISLPAPTKDEGEALGEPAGSCSDRFQLLPGVVIAEEKESILEALLGSQRLEHLQELEVTSDLSETWFQRLDDLICNHENLDPGLCWGSVCQDGTMYNTNDSEKPQVVEVEDIKAVDPVMCTADFGLHGSTNGKMSSHPYPGPTESDVDRQMARIQREHSLLTPWCESYPSRLQSYLDGLDAARQIALSSFDLSPYGDGILESESFFEDSDTPDEPDSFCSVQSAARELVQYLHSNCPPAHPVDADQLIELQAYMQQVVRFRAYLARSLADVRNALNRREERYRMREANGSIAAMMKSHGEASPLAKTTSVDEEWVDDDAWTAPVAMRAEFVAFHKVGCKPDKVNW
ncbi:hypothetical protein HJFPF1_07624 [Paramyrothecium foliicola]|nr:hypothetical protein HJFPF1_07624 [Paramyrothecium foliicola]